MCGACYIQLIPQAVQIITTTSQKPADPGVIGICNNGFSVDSNGVTICNKDSNGYTRSAHEVNTIFKKFLLL